MNSNLDFLFLSESWLTELSPTTAFAVQGYHVFRKDRQSGGGGGVLLYVRNHYKCVEVNLKSTQDLESIIVTIVLSPQMSFTVIGLYRPPNSTKTFYDNLKSVAY